MSMGGATGHPALADAPVKPAVPANISQKQSVPNKRMEETNVSQLFGHEGLPWPIFRALKGPRRVSSILAISSGLDQCEETWPL